MAKKILSSPPPQFGQRYRSSTETRSSSQAKINNLLAPNLPSSSVRSWPRPPVRAGTCQLPFSTSEPARRLVASGALTSHERILRQLLLLRPPSFGTGWRRCRSASQGPSLPCSSQGLLGSAAHLRVVLLTVDALALAILGALHAGLLRLGHVAVTGRTGFLGVHVRLATFQL